MSCQFVHWKRPTNLVARPQNRKLGTRIRPTANQDACVAFLLQRSVSIRCANIRSLETSKRTAHFHRSFSGTGATFWFISRPAIGDFCENVIPCCICTTDKMSLTPQLRSQAWNGEWTKQPNASFAQGLSSRSSSWPCPTLAKNEFMNTHRRQR